MPRYRLTDVTFINNALREAGTIVEHAGWPGSTLEAADAVAKRVKTFFDAARKSGRKIADAPDLSEFGEPAPAADADKPPAPSAAASATPPTPATPASSPAPAAPAANPARTPRAKAKKPPQRAGHKPAVKD